MLAHLDQGWLLTLVIMVAIPWLLFLVLGKWHLTRSARSLYKALKATYTGRDELRRVAPGSFPHVDRTFYDSTRDWLVGEGFRFVTDIEDITVTQRHPSGRTFIRTFLSQDGTTSVGIYDLSASWRWRVLVRLSGNPRRVFDISTELSDGSFITTSNATGAFVSHDVPGIVRVRMRKDAPLSAGLAAHEEAVSGALASRPAVEPVRLSSLEQLLESEHRNKELKNAYRRSFGYVTVQDLERLTRKTDVARALMKEIEKLRQSEADGVTPREDRPPVADISPPLVANDAPRQFPTEQELLHPKPASTMERWTITLCHGAMVLGALTITMTVLKYVCSEVPGGLKFGIPAVLFVGFVRGGLAPAFDGRMPWRVDRRSPDRVVTRASEVAALDVDFPIAPFDGIASLRVRTFAAFVRNLDMIVPIVLVAFLPALVVENLWVYSAGLQEDLRLPSGLNILLEVVFGSFAAPAVIFAVVHRLRGHGSATLAAALRCCWSCRLSFSSPGSLS